MNTEYNWLVQFKIKPNQTESHRLEANKLIQHFIDGLSNFSKLKHYFNVLCWRNVMIWSLLKSM